MSIDMTDDIHLVGRQARCSCGKIVQSKKTLPFFEFRGEGSRNAIHSCAHCRYYDVAHTNDNRSRNENICDDFTPQGDIGYDIFYCGCRGWD